MNIVERLKDSLEYEYNLSFSERKQLLEEIDRLNNIIDGLEIFIKNNKVAIGIKKGSNYAIPVEYVLDKLKELKENK